MKPSASIRQIGWPTILFAACILLNTTACDETADQPTTGILKGAVTDTGGLPLADVKIKFGDSSTLSGLDGSFELPDLAEEARGVVTFSKMGYALNGQTARIRAGESFEVTAKLAAVQTTGDIDAAVGGTVTTPNGGYVTLNAGSLEDSSGNAFTGTATLAVTTFDPTTAAGIDTFPGDFLGVDTTGSVVPIMSYGYMEVTIRDSDANELKLAAGQTAEISIPVPTALAGSAPDPMPLWYYDTNDGQWHQEGTGSKEGNIYKATVKHFTIWNWDVPYPASYVVGRVVDCNGQPMKGVFVHIKQDTASASWRSGERSTSADGKFPASDDTFNARFAGVPVVANAQCIVTVGKSRTQSTPQTFTSLDVGLVKDLGDIRLSLPDCTVAPPPPSSSGGTPATLKHDGFDFSAGIIADYTDNDGEIIGWAPSPSKSPEGAPDTAVWWRNNSNTDTENFTKDMGAVSLDSVTTIPTTWDGGKDTVLAPLEIGHVYVVKCQDGYAKFVVKSVSEWDVSVDYAFTSGSSF